MSYFLLPIEIRSIIMDMADVSKFWKQRFTNDVLPLINNGYRLVGFICEYHYNDESCECAFETMNPCGNCYCYGYDKCQDHLLWDFISFEKIHDYSYVLSKYPSIPKETFFYIYDTMHIPNISWGIETRPNLFIKIRNTLKQQLVLKRIEYIKRNAHLWNDRYDLIDECFALGQCLVK